MGELYMNEHALFIWELYMYMSGPFPVTITKGYIFQRIDQRSKLRSEQKAQCSQCFAKQEILELDTSLIWHLYLDHSEIKNKRPMGLDIFADMMACYKNLVLLHLWYKQEALNLKSFTFNVTHYKKIELWSIKARNEVTLP